MDILIIKPSSLGDIIHGLQFAESLRSEISNARISWVSREIFAPLVESCQTVHKTYVFQRKGTLKHFVELIFEIREKQFDWVLDLQGLFRSGILCLLSRAKNKAGRSDAREGSKLFYPVTASMPSNGSESHALDILLNFKPLFDKPASCNRLLVFDTPLSQSFGEQLLSPTFKRVIIFPESRRPEKEWPFYQELTFELLSQNTNLQLIWVGTSQLEPKFPAHPFIHHNRFLNLCGSTQIEELPALVNASDLVLTNDSGPMHLAAALKKEVVALFGPTDPKKYGPWEQMQNVIVAPNGNLKELPVAKVADVLKRKLANH
ncbi:MAG: glycosyltransferase family 9 protein [Verrucomicrobiota bacterium]|nr:glycosyltransferase family 9 protein [Verrucomicrobiota bacterium]MDP6251933.1 glycosyltransferase family 9 protein [Verrucomicrobiota bacterium]MDP7177132.1 glycosyltransferase family 9 protein [Verrucomicrobiota bacterium]MDP7441715.1 glycosyltransferase family 9 protein [Verrucomicrobiota bacterium]